MSSGIPRHAQRVFENFNISKTNGGIKMISYLLKLQIDNVILDGNGQACPGKPQKPFILCLYKRSPFSCKLFF